MNFACEENGNGLTLFATRLLASSGSACGGEGAKGNAGGINGKRGVTGFKTGIDGRLLLCVFVPD